MALSSYYSFDFVCLFDKRTYGVLVTRIDRIPELLHLVDVGIDDLKHVVPVLDSIGTHMSALLFARRTVEEKPPDARSKMCLSSFSLSSTVNASANDVTCEIWEIYAV